MTFASVGPVTSQHTGAVTNLSLPMTSSVGAGGVIVFAAGHDSVSTIVTALGDTASNTYDWTNAVSAVGGVTAGWAYVENGLASGSDTIDATFTGSSDAMARAYAFTGVSDQEVTSTFKNYTESTTYSLSMNNTSGEDAVMFAVFTFPFDFGISTTPAGWTKFADITDTADQQLLGFYKEIGTGVNTCSATLGVTVAYLAAGMILPYSVSGRGRGQAVAIF